MKSQIALLGIGLVIASGVAYAELKPASNTPTAPIVSTPEPAASPATSKSSTKVKTPAPKKSAVPIITKPTISGGGNDEDERDDERNEGREEDDD